MTLIDWTEGLKKKKLKLELQMAKIMLYAIDRTWEVWKKSCFKREGL